MPEIETEKRRDDEMVVFLPWQEVIRTAHRRALEAERERKLAEAADADTAAPA